MSGVVKKSPREEKGPSARKLMGWGEEDQESFEVVGEGRDAKPEDEGPSELDDDEGDGRATAFPLSFPVDVLQNGLVGEEGGGGGVVSILVDSRKRSPRTAGLRNGLGRSAPLPLFSLDWGDTGAVTGVGWGARGWGGEGGDSKDVVASSAEMPLAGERGEYRDGMVDGMGAVEARIGTGRGERLEVEGREGVKPTVTRNLSWGAVLLAGVVWTRAGVAGGGPGGVDEVEEVLLWRL